MYVRISLDSVTSYKQCVFVCVCTQSVYSAPIPKSLLRDTAICPWYKPPLRQSPRLGSKETLRKNVEHVQTGLAYLREETLLGVGAKNPTARVLTNSSITSLVDKSVRKLSSANKWDPNCAVASKHNEGESNPKM